MGVDSTRPNVRQYFACVLSSAVDLFAYSSSVIYAKLFATSSTIYLLGLTKSLASYTLHVTSLDAATGGLVGSGDYPSNIKEGLSQVFVLSDHRASDSPARVVWLEDGVIKSFPLVPDLKTKLSAVKGTVYKSIQDVGVAEYGQFVAIKDDGSGRVVKLTPEGLKVIWEFSDSVSTTFIVGRVLELTPPHSPPLYHVLVPCTPAGWT